MLSQLFHNADVTFLTKPHAIIFPEPSLVSSLNQSRFHFNLFSGYANKTRILKNISS